MLRLLLQRTGMHAWIVFLFSISCSDLQRLLQADGSCCLRLKFVFALSWGCRVGLSSQGLEGSQAWLH